MISSLFWFYKGVATFQHSIWRNTITNAILDIIKHWSKPKCTECEIYLYKMSKHHVLKRIVKGSSHCLQLQQYINIRSLLDCIDLNHSVGKQTLILQLDIMPHILQQNLGYHDSRCLNPCKLIFAQLSHILKWKSILMHISLRIFPSYTKLTLYCLYMTLML